MQAKSGNVCRFGPIRTKINPFASKFAGKVALYLQFWTSDGPERLLTSYDFSEPVSSVVLPGLEVNFARIVEDM